MFISRRSCSRHGGYALIEALVSMMVVAVGVLGIAKLQTVVVASSTEAKARSEAMTLAQAKIDELRNIALQGEHYDTTGGGCLAGSIVLSGNDTPSGVNAAYTRTWTVTPNCTPARHQILVTVAWTGTANENKSIQLNSIIAWNDPRSSTLKLSAGSGTGSGGLAPPTNARLGGTAEDIVNGSIPQTATANADGTYKYFNEATGEWEILISYGSGYQVQLYSKVPIVTFSGIVAIHSDATGIEISNVATYRTDITFCRFPLKFTEQNNPLTYGKTATDNSNQFSDTNDKAAAYVCYVPEGWYGNVAIVQKSYTNKTDCLNQYKPFDGTDKSKSTVSSTQCYYYPYLACPEDNTPTQTGTRSVKILYTDIDNKVVGQTGLTTSNESSLMTDESGLTRLTRLDFVIYKQSNTGFKSCSDFFHAQNKTIIGTIPIASGNAGYAISLRANAPYDASTDPELDPTNGKEGTPSIVYPTYVVE
jgi:type IV pilus assembly protein PilV